MPRQPSSSPTRSSRIAVTLASLALLSLVGCASSGKGIYTFSQHEAGNICAADSLGAGLVSTNATTTENFASIHASMQALFPD
jgi:hypothetical protein